MSTQISSIKFDYLKLQHVSSGFRCRGITLTDEALLAETSFLLMFSLLLKEFVFYFYLIYSNRSFDREASLNRVSF